MKKCFFMLALIFSASLLCVHPAEAHFLETDRTIGAVLHVDPDDNPIAGQQASFFFEFKDKTNKFAPQSCDCTFTVKQNGTAIYTQPLFQNNASPSLTNASVFYTFPTRDVYQIIVSGKPLPGTNFQPFTLVWNFRIDQQAGTNKNASPVIPPQIIRFAGAGIALLIIILMVIVQIRNENKKNSGGR